MVYVWLNWLSWLSFETGTGVVHQIALIKKWKEKKKLEVIYLSYKHYFYPNFF